MGRILPSATPCTPLCEALLPRRLCPWGLGHGGREFGRPGRRSVEVHPVECYGTEGGAPPPPPASRHSAPCLTPRPAPHHPSPITWSAEISAFRRQFAGLRRRGGSEAQGWGRGRGRAHRLIQPAPYPSGPPGVRAGAHVPGALPRQLPDYTQGRAHQAPGEQRQGEDAVSLGAARPESRTLRPQGGPRRHPRGRFAAQQCQWPRAAVTSGAGGLTGSRAEALVPAWTRRM